MGIKNTEYAMNIGENIYKYRTASGMSQTDLANSLEVSRQSVSKWENNSAVPDLERIVNMSRLFGVTLDELVFGEKSEPRREVINELPPQLTFNIKPRVAAGALILIFGMVFFLFSIFWGNHLWFGEEIGELVGLMFSLIGLSLVATNNIRVFTVSAVIYMIYSFVSYSVMERDSIPSYTFIFAASFVLLAWFIVWGLNANKEDAECQKN